MKPKPLKVRHGTMAGDFAKALQEAAAQLRGAMWPSSKYADNPVGFVREALGEEPLPHQIQILEAARDNFKTAVRSGQKTGKTKLVIWLALWWYCTRTDGRVFMLAAIKEQVDRVLWTELKRTIRAGALVGFELKEVVAKNPATGVIAQDRGAEIRGITVRDIEALAGISGDILFIVDEASHMSQPIAEAIEGNLAGGGKMIWISNPTQTTGPFYEVFNNPDKARMWVTYHLSSLDVAAYCDARGLEVKGLANAAVIAKWEEEYKKDSPFWLMRVEGNFVRNETGRIFSLADIELGQAAWDDAPDDAGDLTIGVDPAGPGDGGDECAWCVVRGRKMLWLETRLGVTEERGVEHTRALVKQFRRGDEIPTVIVDVDGPIGASWGGRLRGIGEALRSKRPADSFDFCGVKASNWARRQPLLYERIREELWAGGVKWLRDGGAIISDHKLAVELHAPRWIGVAKGKLKVTPKNEIRTLLQRSPDRADAFLLAVWVPTLTYGESEPNEESELAPERQGAGGTVAGGWGSDVGDINPFDKSTGRGGPLDPYR